MKVLKDVDKVLHIMNRKLNELHMKFDEADGDDAAEISGQEIAIIDIVGQVRHAIEDHGYFGHDYLGVKDLVYVYDYVADAKENAHEYRNPRDTWFMKGRAEGATWACAKLEDRMQDQS